MNESRAQGGRGLAALSGALRRRPALRDALLWAVPAIVLGLVVRVALTIYQPLAYWGSDSESYYAFTFRLLNEGVASIPEKRRYLYPIFLLPWSILPGTPLQWLAWVQHALGLLTLVPLAYVVRKTLVAWRWWVIPATTLYALCPMIVWYEHELLAEAFFFQTFLWAFAAWTAWSARRDSTVLWWVFFGCLALCVLTKPAGRFLWPGLLIGLVYLQAWRVLRWPHGLALAALVVASFTVGDKNQGARLLYSSAFPLTVLDSPLHADLKAEIAPLVRASRERLDFYYLEDGPPKRFLRNGYRDGDYPTWQRRDREDRAALYRAMADMAKEAIKAHPHLFAYIALQRTIGALNWTEFKLVRFDSDYTTQKFEEDYAWFLTNDHRRMLGMVHEVFGLDDANGPRPFADFQAKADRVDREGAAEFTRAIMRHVSAFGQFVRSSAAEERGGTLGQMRPTLQGWWLLAGCGLALLLGRYRESLGVWVVIALGYAVAVHLVGSSNPRFFAAAWPPLIVALFVPLDAVAAALRRQRRGPKNKTHFA